MPSIKLYLLRPRKNGTLKAEPCRVYAWFSLSASQRISFPLDEHVSPRHWDFDKQTVKASADDYINIRLYLDDFKNSIMRLYRDNRHLTFEEFTELALSTYQKKTTDQPIVTLEMIWREYLDLKTDLAPRTVNSYNNSLQAFKDFSKGFTITPESFTVKRVYEYRNWLSKRHKPNTVAKRLKHLKEALSYCKKLNKLNQFSLDEITYKETAGLKLFWTEEELEAIQKAAIPHHLDRVRDLMLIQCHTGQRISDVKRLDKSIQGDKFILSSQKTLTPVEIIITPTVQDILEKYNYKLPRISDQKFNEYLKDLAKIVFPDKTIQVREGKKFTTAAKWSRITSHDNIRTFVNISAARGMTIGSIAKITGKSVATLLKNYLSESQAQADKEMRQVWGEAKTLRIAN